MDIIRHEIDFLLRLRLCLAIGMNLNKFQVGNIFRYFVKTDFDKHPLKACQAGTPDVLCGRSPLDLARIDKWLISRFAARIGLF